MVLSTELKNGDWPPWRVSKLTFRALALRQSDTRNKRENSFRWCYILIRHYNIDKEDTNRNKQDWEDEYIIWCKKKIDKNEELVFNSNFIPIEPKHCERVVEDEIYESWNWISDICYSHFENYMCYEDCHSTHIVLHTNFTV